MSTLRHRKSGDHHSVHPLSPRKRRLRKTLWVLSFVFMVAALAATLFYWINRPAPYAPGEESEDITSQLTRNLPANAPRPKFADLTDGSGLNAFKNFAGARTSQLPEDMGPGLAWGDFDNDGDDDLFLVSAGGALNIPDDDLLPCALYENIGNGQFRKSDAFPDLRIRGMGAAWGDFDGDGYLDLIVSGFNALQLFKNSGPGGGFDRVAAFPSPKGFWAGVSWGDFDRDRDLDLYVCGYVKYIEDEASRTLGSDQLGTFVPYTLNPASYEPVSNLLFRNEGGGTFTEVAEDLGVANRQGRSLGALWHDFDHDGWLDLYVANDISDNVFYRNVSGAFEDISHAAWVADYRSAMGLAAGDYDRDGDDDLFITHWVAQENALYENHWSDFNGTNKPVEKQQYPLRFIDVNELRGLGQVALPFVGWGAEFADFDADGWLDLVVANGNTLEEQDSAPKVLKAQQPFLFWNSGGDFFYDLAPLSKHLAQPHVSRGLAVADFDNDGDLDIATAHLGEGVQLLRNEMQTGHWLKIVLRSKNARGALNGFGDGATVLAYAGGVEHRRTVSSVSYLSQSSRTLHFGLGPAAQVERVDVHWLAGGTNSYLNLASDTTYELRETEPIPRVRPYAGASSPPANDKASVVEFWSRQRAAMDALKLERNEAKAIPLFQTALALNPKHEDSRYYLAQCLASDGRIDAALEQLRILQELNPQSHRAFQQWGNLRAIHARTLNELTEAEASLERARAINPEETGALLILGEVSVLKEEREEAEKRFTAVCRSNPRAVAALYLRGYLAFLREDSSASAALLRQTREALGNEWQPKGTTAEGDVLTKQYSDTSPLSRFYQYWNGSEDPSTAYSDLDRYLRTVRDNF